MDEEKNDNLYFEYSKDYQAIKKEKRDYQIVAYLQGFYQNYGFEFTPTEGSVIVNTPLTQKCLFNLFSSVSQFTGALINGN